MPKATTPTSAKSQKRHNPLEQDILATGHLRTKSSKRQPKDDADEDEHFIDSKASSKILQIGRELAEEDKEAATTTSQRHDAFGFDSRFPPEGGEEDDVYGDEEAWGDEDEEIEEVEVDVLPDDLDTFNRFLPAGDEDPILQGNVWGGGGDQLAPSAQGTRNLADIILAKIAAHESGAGTGGEFAEPEDDYELPPKVVEVYTQYVSLSPDRPSCRVF